MNNERDYHDSQVFYSKVFAEVLLNMAAVQHGFYHMLLCEMNNPAAVRHWRQAVPYIIQAMKK